MIGILAMVSSAEGISISVSSSTGGFTESIDPGRDDTIRGGTIIAADGISNFVKGGGSLRAIHWGSDANGNSAGAGVNIRKAESYSYNSCHLSPERFFWTNSTYQGVSVSESLDVVNAVYINAYANALNMQGKAAPPVDIVLFDQGRNENLTGYCNSATASAESLTTFQTDRPHQRH